MGVAEFESGPGRTGRLALRRRLEGGGGAASGQKEDDDATGWIVGGDRGARVLDGEKRKEIIKIRH